MSGRTFGVQASWDDVFRQLGLDVDSKSLRNAISIADSMNQQTEEFLNRYVTTSTNDKGDLVFDTEGSYTFDGDVTINGDVLLQGDMTLEAGGSIQSSDTGRRAVLTEGTFVPSGFPQSMAGLKLYAGGANEDEYGYIAAYDDVTSGEVRVVSPDYGAGQSILYMIGTLAENAISGYADSVLFEGSADITIRVDTANGISFVASTDVCEIQAGDNIEFTTAAGEFVFSGGELLAPTGTAALPSYAFDGAADTGIYRNGTNALAVSTGGVNHLVLNNNTSYLGGTGFSAFTVARTPSRTDAQLNAGTGGTFVRLYMDTATGRLVRRSTAGA